MDSFGRSPSARSAEKSPGGITVGNQVGTAMRRESDSPSRVSVGGFLAGLFLKSLKPESHEFASKPKRGLLGEDAAALVDRPRG